jgi:HK97 family phage portal protein
MLTRGAFAKILRDYRGFIIGLLNIPTGNVSGVHINRINGERYIIATFWDGHQETIREGEFMYTPNLRFTSDIDPEDPVKIAADVLGLTMALNGFAKDYFENGAHPGGVMECPEKLSDEAYERLKKDFEEKYSGVINQHKTLVLEQGSKFSELQRDLEKSQALESRKFAVIEICRMFGVPPHKVFELDKMTFNNIEQINIEYVQEAIAPLCIKFEQTIYKDLLTSIQQKTLYSKFNVNGLLRGDIATRTAFYHNMRQDGIMNADEIREMEDMNNQPDGQGQIYAINGNMIPVTAIPKNLPKGAMK